MKLCKILKNDFVLRLINNFMQEAHTQELSLKNFGTYLRTFKNKEVANILAQSKKEAMSRF